MALSPTTIATAIAALSVTGVTVKDLTGVPEMVQDRDCPLVYPDPANYISLTKVERDTLGGDAAALKAATYTLHYVYLHRMVGSERGLYAKAQDEVSKLYAFINAVIGNNDALTAIDITPTHGPLMVVQDPSGADFRGCAIALVVTEWINP